LRTHVTVTCPFCGAIMGNRTTHSKLGARTHAGGKADFILMKLDDGYQATRQAVLEHMIECGKRNP